LALQHVPFGTEALGILADGAAGDTIQELRLQGQRPGPTHEVPASLALPRLRRLSLRDCRAHWPALASLDTGRLDELQLWGQDLSAVRWDALGDGPRSLQLVNCSLGDAAATRLAAWPGLARVRALGLPTNNLTNAGVRAIAESPHTGSLEAINLYGNKQINDVAPLIRSPIGGRLRWLYLPPNAPVAPLMEGRLLPVLRQLLLGQPSWRVRDLARLRAALPGCTVG
jgi:hypothetical protein